jgi:exosortase/archaeosortase family protein
LVRPVGALAVAVATYTLVAATLVHFEGLAMAYLSDLLSSNVFRAGGAPWPWVVEPGVDVYAVVPSPSCSAAFAVSAVVAVGAMLMRGPWRRRCAGIVVASTIAIVLNITRLVGVTLVGAQWGRSTLVVVHDWGGTAMTIVGVLFAFLVLARIVSPRRSRAEA